MEMLAFRVEGRGDRTPVRTQHPEAKKIAQIQHRGAELIGRQRVGGGSNPLTPIFLITYPCLISCRPVSEVPIQYEAKTREMRNVIITADDYGVYESVLEGFLEHLLNDHWC